MAVQVHCPVCRTQLTVSDLAPETLTCPRCLTKIRRPAVPPPLPLAGSPAAPLRALPLDEEVERDGSLVRKMIIGIVLLIVAGSGLISLAGGSAEATIAIFLCGAIIVAVTFAITAAPKPPPASPAIFEDRLDPGPAADGPRQLEYRTFRPEDKKRSIRAGPFILGFFAAIAVAFGCFMLLGATFDTRSGGNIAYLLLVVLAITGLCILGSRLNKKDAMVGFAPGCATGLILGMLALGPCAFCYLMTIH
jgi:hypothetical protein